MADPIRVLTYNVKMLPRPFGDAAADKARAQAIVSAITSAAPAHDILCMQEVFDERVRDELSAGLQGPFPHQVAKSASDDIFNQDSGLFFASRFPIVGSKFVEFAAAQPGTADSLADKGVLGVHLDASSRWPGSLLVVFDTHLQSTEAYDEVRRKQLGQARGFIRKVLSRLRDRATTAALMLGDFNIIAETESRGGLIRTPESSRMLSILGTPRDLFREVNPSDPGFTWDGPRNTMIPRDDTDVQRLDYALAFDRVPVADDNAVGEPILRMKCLGCEVAPFGPVPGRALSDHYGVSATLGA